MKYYTCTEIAEKYGVTRQCVHYHVRNGTIESVRAENGILLIPETAKLPVAWYNGEKGRTAAAKYEMEGQE